MYKNVLIALDDSQAAERALHRAIAMAEIEKGDLFVVVVNGGLPLWPVGEGNFDDENGLTNTTG
jgi:nucleotide-binding universal stress UspA family protein